MPSEPHQLLGPTCAGRRRATNAHPPHPGRPYPVEARAGASTTRTRTRSARGRRVPRGRYCGAIPVDLSLRSVGAGARRRWPRSVVATGRRRQRAAEPLRRSPFRSTSRRTDRVDEPWSCRPLCRGAGRAGLLVRARPSWSARALAPCGKGVRGSRLPRKLAKQRLSSPKRDSASPPRRSALRRRLHPARFPLDGR